MIEWRKSSASAANGCCVEVAWSPGQVWIRDSKDPDGPVLRVSREAWRTFVTGLR